mmetsp:Transcript_21415/g.47600  ORF Transcript_21415/g.47600 Transcript_21415/m.47600 type:complete len:102 (-) Transcript_21415:554-859(-)
MMHNHIRPLPTHQHATVKPIGAAERNRTPSSCRTCMSNMNKSPGPNIELDQNRSDKFLRMNHLSNSIWLNKSETMDRHYSCMIYIGDELRSRHNQSTSLAT